MPSGVETLLLALNPLTIKVIGTRAESTPGVPSPVPLGGLLAQAGSDVVVTFATAWIITYPVAFPTATLTVVYSLGDDNFTGGQPIIDETLSSATQFGGFLLGGDPSDTIRINWIALGY